MPGPFAEDVWARCRAIRVPAAAEGDDQDKAGHDAEDAPTPTLVGGPCAFFLGPYWALHASSHVRSPNYRQGVERLRTRASCAFRGGRVTVLGWLDDELDRSAQTTPRGAARGRRHPWSARRGYGAGEEVS